MTLRSNRCIGVKRQAALLSHLFGVGENLHESTLRWFNDLILVSLFKMLMLFQTAHSRSLQIPQLLSVLAALVRRAVTSYTPLKNDKNNQNKNGTSSSYPRNLSKQLNRNPNKNKQQQETSRFSHRSNPQPYTLKPQTKPPKTQISTPKSQTPRP